MTTPERFRRRQLIEGVVLIFLAVMMLAQTWYFNEEDNQQKECLASQFQDLTNSFQERSKINEKDSKAKTETDVREALDKFIRTQEQIDQDRKNKPVPPFPPGRCS